MDRVDEGLHQFLPRHCDPWSPWRYSWHGPYNDGHIEADRQRTCTTMEYWEVTHSSQECHSEIVCGVNPQYTDEDLLAAPGTPGYYRDPLLHEYNGRCCALDGRGRPSGCRPPEGHREVCAARVYDRPMRQERQLTEVERQHWVEVPIWAEVDRYPLGVTQRFEDIFKYAKLRARGGTEEDGPFDLPQLAVAPVTRGVSISIGLPGPKAIDGVQQYELTVDGEPLAPEGPIETEALRPGDHLVSVVVSGPEGKVRTGFVLSVEEPVELVVPSDRLALKYDPRSEKNQVMAAATVINHTADEHSVTISVLSSPAGWSVGVEGTGSFLIGANERQDVPIRLAITDPIALARPVSSFVVAARLNRSGDRSRDVVATLGVTVMATPELLRLGTALAKGNRRRIGETETAIFDAAVAMSMRPVKPKGQAAQK